MKRSHDSTHGILHMVLGCGLMLVVVFLLASADGSWARWIVLAAFLVCPLLMLLMILLTGRTSHGEEERRESRH